VGSLGLPVTPGRSIAADQKLFPPAALAFLHTEVPALADDGTTVSEGPLTRFVLVHDTGGAIRGTDRADFFWGRGKEAAYRAGSMKHPGRLFFLVPRSNYSFPQ
jgi:membrane-bound lytic murein transglycosylase A